MLLETLSQEFRKARSVNQTSNGYVSKVPTATEPSGDAGTATGASVIDLGKGGSTAQNGLLAVFYGTGSNNNTFSARVIGWRSAGSNAPDTMLWIPVVLVEFALTLSSTPAGVVGKTIVATELFADTIALTYGNDDISVDIVSPAADIIAHAVLDLKGFQKVEFSFTTGGSATDCNSLLALL
jgi:hypothetical protein